MAAKALERSMKVLRKEGYIVGKTEHWNSFVPPHGIRQDLFGFIDALALPYPLPGWTFPITAVQCVNTHLPEHITKIQQNEAAQRWLALGQRIVIHHWRQRSKDKVKFWDLECIEVKL